MIRFSWRGAVHSLLLLTSFAGSVGLSAAADEKKEEKKKEPPRVTVAIPLGVVPGITNKIKIRGANLTNATEVRFPGLKDKVDLKIKSSAKADVPKEQDAKKWGDTQLEVELRLPLDAPPGTNLFTIVSPDGESEPHALIINSAASLIAEKEPNGSFRQAQPLELGKIVQGVISEAKDVDVFRIDGVSGKTFVAEVIASRYGSLLDSILTLYDAQGHIIASSDDTESGTDSVLRTTFPSNGHFFLSLIDAHDHGGAACVYQLQVTSSK